MVSTATKALLFASGIGVIIVGFGTGIVSYMSGNATLGNFGAGAGLLTVVALGIYGLSVAHEGLFGKSK
jgi:hypothetical protein